MGKKNISGKLREFYRGPGGRPTRIASQDEMNTIFEGIKEYQFNKDCSFICDWLGQPTQLKLTIGLSSGLRSIRQKRAKAIIYDNTISPHIRRYLDYASEKLSIPALQAQRLIDFAPQIHLNTIALITLLGVSPEKEHQQARQNPLSRAVHSKAFEKLCLLLESITVSPTDCPEFKQPLVERIPSTGASKKKKAAKKLAKKLKINQSSS